MNAAEGTSHSRDLSAGWTDFGAWEGYGIRREAFFFDSEGVELYGSLFSAADLSLPLGVVACNSWGVEADRCDPLQRSFALEAARHGGAGMVFHYPGYGDSYGDLADVGLADLAAAASAAVAEASRRCPGLTWTMAGFMFGAAVAALGRARADVDRLLLVQPTVRPGAHLRWLAARCEPIAPGPAPREMLEPGEAPGFAYGYPIPARIAARPEQADAEVAAALEEFDGEGTAIRHLRAAVETESLPDRFELIDVPGAWRFGAENHPRLLAALTDWLERYFGGADSDAPEPHRVEAP